MTTSRLSISSSSFSAIAVAPAVALGLYFATAPTLETARLYYGYPNTTSRALNVRMFSEYQRLTIVDDFLSARIRGAANPVVFLGDSQTYGMYQAPQDTMPHYLAAMRPGALAVNAAVVDGRFADTLELARRADRHGARTIFANVTLSHFGVREEAGFRRLTSLRIPPVFLSDPNTRRKISDDLGTRTTVSQSFNMVKLKPDRYDFNRAHLPHYDAMLKGLAALKVRTTVYLSPHPISAVRDYGYDVAGFLGFAAELTAMCRRYKLECLDLTDTLDVSHFLDISHLNTRGHRALAELLGGY